MTNNCTSPVARVRDLHDLLGVIPHLLGFHPEESLVVLVVVDGQVELTARADLVDLEPEGHLEVLLDRMMLRWPAARVWLVGYSASERQGWRMLRRGRLHLGDALAGEPLCVSRGRYRVGSADGPRYGYDPATAPSAAAATVHGLQARPNRAAVRRSICDDSVPSLGAECSLARALQRVAVLDSAALPAEMDAAVAAGLAAPANQAPDDLVWLALLSTDPQARDRALLAITSDSSEACVALWSQVVRACPHGLQGQPLALLGWSAWVSGDGAMQSICLEELERLGESLPLQRLLDRLNHAMVPPSFWNDLRAELLDAVQPGSLQAGPDEPASHIRDAHGEGAHGQVA
ncbi:DUF4192 domain-containing protein [Micropruina sp.]|uniref:DUF4192 domain-containing protein n=1 Tax=Micropruina sp. TaxID=2737536 RepID=UPI0039E21ED6